MQNMTQQPKVIVHLILYVSCHLLVSIIYFYLKHLSIFYDFHLYYFFQQQDNQYHNP